MTKEKTPWTTLNKFSFSYMMMIGTMPLQQQRRRNVSSSLLLILLILVGSAFGKDDDDFQVKSLTLTNYQENVAGKSVFIKFFADWCGHCKRLEPEWKKLAKEFDGKDDIALIAEVDCTENGRTLCESYNINSFPTIKYGDPYNLEEYNGKRTYDELYEFANKIVFKPICSLKHIESCTAEQKTLITNYESMTRNELLNLITEEENKLKNVEKIFHTKVDKLQTLYEQYEKEKNDSIMNIRTNGGLKYMKSVIHIKEINAMKEAKAPDTPDDDDDDDDTNDEL